MTVCTPHSYAGPRECPHCQLEACQLALKRQGTNLRQHTERLRQAIAQAARLLKQDGDVSDEAFDESIHAWRGERDAWLALPVVKSACRLRLDEQREKP